MELQQRVQDMKDYPPRVLLQAPHEKDPTARVVVKCQLLQTQVLEYTWTHIQNAKYQDVRLSEFPCQAAAALGSVTR